MITKILSEIFEAKRKTKSKPKNGSLEKT